jgi:hypothetical protein
MSKFAPYAKAIAALLVSAFGMYQAARGAETPGGQGITSDEWTNIIITALLAGGAVWGIPNVGATLFATVSNATLGPPTSVSTNAGGQAIVSAPTPGGQHALDKWDSSDPTTKRPDIAE